MREGSVWNRRRRGAAAAAPPPRRRRRKAKAEAGKRGRKAGGDVVRDGALQPYAYDTLDDLAREAKRARR